MKLDARESSEPTKQVDVARDRDRRPVPVAQVVVKSAMAWSISRASTVSTKPISVELLRAQGGLSDELSSCESMVSPVVEPLIHVRKIECRKLQRSVRGVALVTRDAPLHPGRW